MKKISIIVPCYNEAIVLPTFYCEITKVSDDIAGKYGLEFEYIFIDDGSSDDTLPAIKELAAHDSQNRVRYIALSRNFGKESAMFAGLENSSGDYVVIMDADLQDPPSMIEEMYSEISSNGYDCVAARRINRKGEKRGRSFFARIFYKIINKLSKTQITEGARDFRMMSRQMVDEVIRLGEKNRFSKGLLSWVGFDTKCIEYENIQRAAGETSWSSWGLIKYSLEGIIAFTTVPLVIATVVGIVTCAISILLALFYGIKTLIFGDPAGGFPTIICVVLFLGGIQLFFVGILSQYIAKMYTEVKNRPIYIMKENNINNN
jgi:glycosyltransferase involved in cell wall biosynthesis